MNANEVNVSVVTQEQEDAKAALEAFRQKLPYLINLTIEDRRSMPKIGDKERLAFVRRALDVAEQHPDVLPGFLSVNQMRSDVQQFEFLSSIELAVTQLLQQIEDTRMQIGSQALTAARTVYASAKSKYAGPAVKTAADELSKHFERKPKAAAPETSGAEAQSTVPIASTHGT